MNNFAGSVVGNNTPAFVRRSLIGRGQLSDGVRNLTASLPPPILQLPPEMPLEKLVMSVVSAYKLSLGKDFSFIIDNPVQVRQYVYKLMDAGFDFTNHLNYRGASDIFSLCVLIYPNYYFDYLLAIVRFKLRDYQGSLQLLDNALAKIRQRQALERELATLAKEANFTENFYSFYVSILLFNHQKPKAAAMVDFILKQNLITSPTIILTLLNEYRHTDDRSTTAKIAKAAIVMISNLPDPNLRASLLARVKDILSTR